MRAKIKIKKIRVYTKNKSREKICTKPGRVVGGGRALFVCVARRRDRPTRHRARATGFRTHQTWSLLLPRAGRGTYVMQ